MIEHDLPPLIKNETCSVTGHRTLKKGFDREKLDEKFKELISKGYRYFLCGMALGFDTECFLSLERLRERYKDIKIVAVVPCSDQAAKFSQKEKAEYNRMLSSADLIAAEKRTYFKNCMIIRNDFLAENCSYLLAYFDGVSKKSGTYYTLSRAKKLGVETENIY